VTKKKKKVTCQGEWGERDWNTLDGVFDGTYGLLLLDPHDVDQDVGVSVLYNCSWRRRKRK
jgi:hypothetical protein